MAVKEWFQKLRPVQLYVILFLTGLFFTVELIISHFTHSLTLLVDSYHMLCNMITLTGCIIAIKKLHLEDKEEICNGEQTKVAGDVVESNKHNKQDIKSSHQSESSLKNTFGWARIDILVMLIGCIFLGSLCFSVLVEAVQTLIHIDHQDEMHFPLVVLMVAAVGLLLNGFCYSLIGGYTFHQGSYLHVTESGDVVLEKTVTIDSLKKGQRRLSSQSRRTVVPPSVPPPPPLPSSSVVPLPTPPASTLPVSTYTSSQRQGSREMIRDVIGCIFVIICGLVVYFTTGLQFAKYLDPVISIISAVSLLILSYPYMKESGLILLQTIPDDINIDSLRSQLLHAFPDIVNVHDLHIWQLTTDRIFFTAHIIFLHPAHYLQINKEMTKFFNEQGITQITIQAEFVPESEKTNGGMEVLLKTNSKPCLMPCMTEECRRRHCCVRKEELKDKGDLEVIKIEGAASATINKSTEISVQDSKSNIKKDTKTVPEKI